MFVSCNQYDGENIQKFDDTSFKLDKNQLDNFKLRQDKSLDVNVNYQIMDYFQEQNNIDIKFSNDLYELNKKTTSEKFEIALQTGVLNQEDMNRIKNLEKSLRVDGFNNVIINFEKDILSLHLSNKKFKIYTIFLNALRLINYNDSMLFKSNSYLAKRLDLDCWLAGIAFAAACVGLATLEAGTAGLATAAVVVGYIAASTALVRACKGGEEQEEK